MEDEKFIALTNLDGSQGATMGRNSVHRYNLWRSWDELKDSVLFIALNPSRADHEFNDPTITRCRNFAESWGYGKMYFANLFTFRTPYPNVLYENISIANNDISNLFLRDMIERCIKIVVCWGSWSPPHTGTRVHEVLSMIIQEFNKQPYCFGVNQDGEPKHPLYLSKTTQLIPYEKKILTAGAK